VLVKNLRLQQKYEKEEQILPDFTAQPNESSSTISLVLSYRSVLKQQFNMPRINA